MITADEEYVVTLNGKRIGAGAFAPGAPLDVYEAGPLLLPGGNRLLVELRSGDGTGGLLASLVDEATGRQIVGTDDGWRILPAHQLGLVRGWMPIGAGEPAFAWGYPPIGRWGSPKVGAPRPLLGEEMGAPLPAAAMLALSLPAGLTDGRPPGSPVLYDWGRTVEGYLTLEMPPAKDLGMALLFTGETPPDPLAARRHAGGARMAGRAPPPLPLRAAGGLEAAGRGRGPARAAGAGATPAADPGPGVRNPGAAATNAGGGRSLEQTPAPPGRRSGERPLARASPRPRGEILVEHLGKYRDHALMVSTHRGRRGVRVQISLRSGFEADKGRKVVAEGAPVRPQASRPAVAVGERMDADPLAVCVGQEGQEGKELVGIVRIAEDRDLIVQHGDSLA